MDHLPPIDARLQALLGFIDPAHTVADIGCDHGKLAAHLYARGCGRVICGDISAPSLQKAATLLEKLGHGAPQDLRVGDGLEILREEDAVHTAVLSGMGGHLIIDILRRGAAQAAHLQQLVLQPQRDVGALRQYLHQNHWRVADEALVYHNGFYYHVLRVQPGEEPLLRESPFHLQLGPLLPQSRPATLVPYLQQALQRTQSHAALVPETGREETVRYRSTLLQYCKECEEMLQWISSLNN